MGELLGRRRPGRVHVWYVITVPERAFSFLILIACRNGMTKPGWKQSPMHLNVMVDGAGLSWWSSRSRAALILIPGSSRVVVPVQGVPNRLFSELCS
jgi:hypothetical protein